MEDEEQKGITPKEFSAKIKAKYPQYADIDDDILVDKIIAKYPQYKSQIDFTTVKKKDSSQPTSEQGYANSYEDTFVNGFNQSTQDQPVDTEQPQRLQEFSLINDWKNALKSGGYETAAGLAGTPNQINKTIASVMLPKESLDELNKLDPSTREALLNLSFSGAEVGTSRAKFAQAGAEKQNEYTALADKYRSQMTEYEGNIIDDVYDAATELNPKEKLGKVGKVYSRISTSIVESLPAMALSL